MNSKLMYHNNGDSFYVVDKKVIWNCIDDEHKSFIKNMVNNFGAEVRLIKSGDKVFFNKKIRA